MTTINVDGTQASVSGSAGNVAFVVVAGSFTETITGFRSGDTLSFVDNTLISVSNTSYTDGNVTLAYASGGKVANVVLTGLTASQDASINFGSDLNTVFGTGTLSLSIKPAGVTVAGTSGNDVLSGSNAVFWGGPGNDTITGTSGVNTTAYSGSLNQYTITNNGGVIAVADNISGRDGTDTLTNIQHIQFTDYSINTTMKAEAAKLPTATVNSLTELYVAYFARTPDATGLSYWIDKAAAGESLTAISKEFYNAGVQFSALTGYSATMSNSDFIKIVYANVLDRTGATAPPAADIAYWDNQIQTGATTKEGLIQRMLSDAHSFANDPTWGWVPQLLNNKIAVGYQAAVTDGLDYTTPSVAITQGMAIAQAVTPTDTSAAVGLIGVGANIHL